MATYGTLKTMKSASIGTIMPWTGELTAIPAGWLICNGQTLNAQDYPLLAQNIGDNYGGSNFSGSFPNYTGQIALPAINQRALCDIDTSYFDNTNNTDTTEALAALVSPGTTDTLIGSDTDNGVGTSYNAYTDINFSYTPENDFTGKLSGATLNETFGSETVYMSHRKLGRRHLTIHSHPATYSTLYLPSSGTRPGQGVAAWGEINYRIQRASFDQLDYSQVQAQLNVQYTNDQGFGGGAPGVVIGNVQGEEPTFNLKPFNTVGSPISNWFGPYQVPNTKASNPMDENFLAGDTLLYAPGGGSTTIANTNFDPGSANSGDVQNFTKAMFDSNAISFNQNTEIAGQQAVIQPHNHEPFEVQFDKANLRLPTSTSVNVITNVIPGNVDKALNINVSVPTPSLICLYLIRAY
jgi:hypothetical protein